MNEHDITVTNTATLSLNRREVDLKIGYVFKCPPLNVYLTLRSLTLYIYGAHILDVSRSHTKTQHSR